MSNQMPIYKVISEHSNIEMTKNAEFLLGRQHLL